MSLRNIPGSGYQLTQLMQQLIRQNQLLLPLGGTPLDRIVTSSTPLVLGKYDTWIDDAYHNVIVSSCTIGTHTHSFCPDVSDDDEYPANKQCVSTHTRQYAEYVASVAKIISNNLALAKDASTMIRDAFDHVSKAFDSGDHAFPINIIPVVGSGVIGSQALYQFANSFCSSDRAGDAKGMNVARVHQTYDSINDLPISQLIKTGINSVDAELSEWALNGGAKIVYDVYHELFTSGYGIRSGTNDTRGERITAETLGWMEWSTSSGGIDKYLALLLIAKNIKSTNPEYVNSNMHLNEIENSYLSIQRFAAISLIKSLDTIARGRKVGKVVYAYGDKISIRDQWDNVNYDIIVDGVTYAEFITAGGTPEMIMGSYLTDHLYVQKDLLARGDQLIKAWKEGEANIRRQRSQIELSNILKCIRNRLYSDINSLDPDSRHRVASDCINEELARADKHLTKENIPRLYDIIRELYSAVFFSGTSVQQLLRTIDEIKVDTESDEDNILRIALIEYVTRYLTGQTVLVKLNPT